MARLISRDLRPDGATHLKVATLNGEEVTVVQPPGAADDPGLWAALDKVVADHARKRQLADSDLVT